MNRIQLSSRTIVILLGLCLAISCHTESTEPCLLGECCWLGYKNTVLRRIEGSRAGFLGRSFLFEDQVFGAEYKTVPVCPTQTQELEAMSLENNSAMDPRTGGIRLLDSTRLYPYKVWGTVYLIDVPNTLVATRGFRVDRVEKVQ